MICQKCGHELPELFTSVYCPYCDSMKGKEWKWSVTHADEIRGLHANMIILDDVMSEMPMDLINLIISDILYN